ncbi:MAG TPA: response regulator [Blastocatellia bacterium]|nr:response regulator [Blastocatellia bacterium]
MKATQNSSLTALVGKKVMVVDDETDTLKLMEIMLRQYGVEVITCDSAAVAMERLPVSRPDAIVIDIAMPEVDGYALIQQVRTLPAEQGGAIPAIALTAYTHARYRVKALNWGYQVYLAKPFEPSRLAAALTLVTGRVLTSGHSFSICPHERDNFIGPERPRGGT